MLTQLRCYSFISAGGISFLSVAKIWCFLIFLFFQQFFPFSVVFLATFKFIVYLCPLNTGEGLGGGVGATLVVRNIEALCSSCALKPEKFQNVAREHDSFHAKAWTLSFSHIGFSQDLRVGMWTYSSTLLPLIKKSSKGLGR